MKTLTQLKRGKGPLWSRAKHAARSALSLHLPSGGIIRPVWQVLYRFHVAVRESFIWARRFLWNEPLFRSQCAAVGSGLWMEELPYLQGHGRIVIGDGVRLSGKPHITFCNRHFDAPELSIGAGTFLGHLCDLRIARQVTIGSHCLIAAEVMIADYDGHPLEAAARRRGQPTPLSDVRPVTIGDDVWIGHGAVILKGVTIGNRAVIGARAVVTRDVPADCVVAGNPARVVRELSVNEKLTEASPEAASVAN